MRLPFRFLLAYCCACSAGSHAPAQGPRGATLELHFSAGGQPTVARVYIFDQDGRPLLIPGAIHYSRPGEVHSVVDRRAVMQLAPGKYRVRAEKGAEFRPAEKMATLEPGAATRLDMEIPRFHEMNQRGWYSGDLHIHRAPEEMPLLLRAEELNVGPTITRHLGMSREPPPPFPPTHLVPADQAHIASQQNQEVERLGRGHGAVVLLNTSSPIDPNMTVLYPLDLEYCRQARAEGGFVDAEKPIWKNVPVNVAFGAIDAIGIVNNHFHPNGVLLEAEKFGSMERDSPAYQTPAGFAQWMIDLYYSFLQCGFRIPVSAGSASGVMPVWPGFERVYVHLSGPFSYTRWFQDLKAGRSIATNGPLLEVYVEGQPPGFEFAWEGPIGVTVAIEAHAQDRLDRVEIVYNGEVIRSFPAGGNPVFQTALNLTITEPGWLVVRCFEPKSNAPRYAHSSPFYFLRDSKLPVKKEAALKWAGYVRRLAASLDAADCPSREAFQKAQAVFREAESTYHRLAR